VLTLCDIAGSAAGSAVVIRSFDALVAAAIARG
jgi:hypothetical protein